MGTGNPEFGKLKINNYENKIIIALVAVVAWLGQSCETDPAFDFKDDGKIYFKYPKK